MAAAKRNDKEAAYAAAMAAQAPPPICTDASGARIRLVAVHLTEFARGCAGMAGGNPKRWATLYGVSPRTAVAKTLQRLGVGPRAVQVQPHIAGADGADIDLCAEREGQLVPLATFWDGLTEAEVRDALQQLEAERWEPRT